MKRAAALVATALVVTCPAFAHAEPSKNSKRTIAQDYQVPLGASVADGLAVTLGCVRPAATACWTFTTNKGEKVVRVTAQDATGTPVGLQVFLDGDYDNVQLSCGSATLKVNSRKVTEVQVRVAYDPACQAVATAGTLTAVISNR